MIDARLTTWSSRALEDTIMAKRAALLSGRGELRNDLKGVRNDLEDVRNDLKRCEK
jgi:hypothetical protein